MILRDIWRRARKDHQCSECPYVIRKGRRYRYTSGFFDGHAYDVKTCAACAPWVDYLLAHDLADANEWHGLYEYMYCLATPPRRSA